MAQQEKEKKTKFSLVEIPTQTGIFVKNNETDEILDDKTVIAVILNYLEEIKKALA